AWLDLAVCSARLGTGQRAVVQKYLQGFESQLPRAKGNNDVLLEVYQQAGKTCGLMGEPKKALVYFEKYYTLHDSLLIRERSMELLDLQAKYETEKKEHAIKTLEQKNRISSLELKAQSNELKNRNIIIALCVFALLATVLLVYFWYNRQRLKAAYEKGMAI